MNKYKLLLLGYKPVQHFAVLNTVGSCNTNVSIIILYYGTTVVYAVHRLPERRYAAQIFHKNITENSQTDHKDACVLCMECCQLSVTNMAAVRYDRVTCDNFKV
jgi:hypothetical protein